MTNIFEKGQKVTIRAIGVTLFFALAKAIAGFLSGSVLLIGDAVHSAADSLSIFAVWFGLKIAKKKPTSQFPYGFYKAESIIALLVSLLILFAGYEIAKESFSKIFTLSSLEAPFIAMGVAIIDALVMFFMGSYEVKVGKEINSQSLMAAGKESKMHLLSSSVVFVGLVSSYFGIAYLEGIMGILVSLFIFEAGVEIARDSIFALMDVSPSREVENKVEKILNDISGIRGFENLKLRKSGPFVFGEVTAKIGKKVDVKRAHEISDNIEKEIKKKIRLVDSFLVTVSPYQTKKHKICIPIEGDRGLDSKISAHFARANKFIFLDTDEGEIKRYYIKENPCKEREIRAGLCASDFVVQEKIDCVITKEMGPISLHILRDDIVDVYKIGEGTVKEIFQEFFQKRLSLLKEPTREKI